jgi:alkyldihydroxyacetonephosphate synthase
MEPVAPIEFGVPHGAVSARFPERTNVGTALLAALDATCGASTDPNDLVEHGRDWWPLALHWALAGEVPNVPAVVVRPRSTTEVAQVAAACNDARVPLTVSGGRSSVSGGAVPARGGVALDMSLMSGVTSVDAVSGLVTVLAGTFGPDLEDQLAPHGLRVGHYPQSFAISTVGGWVGARGAGQFSTRYGKIDDMVAGLEVVLADGRVVHVGGAPAASDGPDLASIFIGSEGTLGIVTSATLRAHPTPQHEARAAWRLRSFGDGIAACRDAVRHGATPAVLRLYDPAETKRSHGGDGESCILLVLDEGDHGLVSATMNLVARSAASHGAEPGDESRVAVWLEHRNDTSALQALSRRGYVVDTMEVAAPWSRLPDVYGAVTGALRAVPGCIAASAHLSHSYLDGACLYFSFAAKDDRPVDVVYRELWDAGQRAALLAGANLAHHHGVGLNRSRFMAEALGNGLDVLRALKASLDRHGILNPGKLGLGQEVWP